MDTNSFEIIITMLNQTYKHSQSLKMVFVNEINSETDGEKNKGELS